MTEIAMLMKCEELCRSFTELEPTVAKACLCMCIDQVAKMWGQTTVEMIDEIRPVAQLVHEQFGDAGLL